MRSPKKHLLASANDTATIRSPLATSNNLSYPPPTDLPILVDAGIIVGVPNISGTNRVDTIERVEVT